MLYSAVRSTTVEITIGYLTVGTYDNGNPSTTVEITIGYLTTGIYDFANIIYNSRNYYRLLNGHTGRLAILYLQQ